MPDDRQLAAWFEETFYPLRSRTTADGLDSLDDRERVTFLVGLLVFEMYGGPHAVYSNHPSGALLGPIADSLDRIGASDAARTMRTLNSLFPGGMPDYDEETREKQLESLLPDAEAKFAELERSYEEPLPHGSGKAILRLLYRFWHEPPAV